MDCLNGLLDIPASHSLMERPSFSVQKPPAFSDVPLLECAYSCFLQFCGRKVKCESFPFLFYFLVFVMSLNDLLSVFSLVCFSCVFYLKLYKAYYKRWMIKHAQKRAWAFWNLVKMCTVINLCVCVREVVLSEMPWWFVEISQCLDYI